MAVCVALIWIFLLDFDCKQLEISYKCRMLVVLCLIFKRFLEYVPEVSLLKYISPCDVASISARPITAVNVIYTVLFFLVADWILWRAARRQMEQVDL